MKSAQNLGGLEEAMCISGPIGSVMRAAGHASSSQTSTGTGNNLAVAHHVCRGDSLEVPVLGSIIKRP